MSDEMEAMMTRIEAKISEEFRKMRLEFSESLRRAAAEKGDGPEKQILLIMAEQWEEAAAA